MASEKFLKLENGRIMIDTVSLQHPPAIIKSGDSYTLEEDSEAHYRNFLKIEGTGSIINNGFLVVGQ